MKKKIFTDATFWMLIAVNGYLVYRYYLHPELFMTLVWLYWSQSMLLGIFTILDLLTIKNATATTYKVNGVLKTLLDDKKSRWNSARFFTIVYGVLHLLYSLFLLSMANDHPPVQWDFFKYFLLIFLAGQILQFIQQKIRQSKEATDTGPIIFSPFIRVLPVHLTIIFSSFFPGGGVGIFLVLKSVADVVTYIITKPAYKNRDTDAALLAARENQMMNL